MPVVRRLDLGYFVRPASEVGSDAVEPRAEPVLAYLVELDRGLLLFDSGIGRLDDDTEAHYRPRRRDLHDALTAAGVSRDDVTLVANCHLHIDHCGGNGSLPGRPVVVQRTELATARGEGYTLPWLVDYPGARYDELDGEAEVAPGVWVIPTPGHTEGHQSLVVRDSDGTVVLAGQAHDFAYQFGSAVLATRTADDGLEPPLPTYPAWVERLLAFDPRRVLFAHDHSVWEPT